MKICIQQPLYLPYSGFFDKIAKSDKCIIFDTAQFVRRNFQNRNRIRVPQGAKWLTVPVEAELGIQIKDVLINNKVQWRDNHWKSIEYNYKNAEYFEEYSAEFFKIYSKEWERLVELDVEIIKVINKILGINKEVALASSFGEIQKKSTELLIEICKRANADKYLSGEFGKGYIDESVFGKADIELCYQIYKCPEYSQRFDGFVPNMSVIDLIFNHGKDSLKILTGKDEANQK